MTEPDHAELHGAAGEADISGLLERARALDPDAFDRLVDLYGPRVHGFLLRMTGRRDDADDLLQEVFLRLVRMLPSYQHDGRFEGWLFRIAGNLVRDRIRRLQRSPIVASISPGEEIREDAGDDGAWDRADEATPRPDSGLLKEEAIDRMQRALDCLSPGEREVVMLRYYSELSFAEIAETMDTPFGTALARSHRGLAKIRAMMEEADA